MKHTLLKEVMTKNAFTVTVDEPFYKVAEIFQKHGIRHVPVVNDKKELVGLVTQRDVNAVVSPKKSEEGTYYYDRSEMARLILKLVMTNDVSVLRPDDTLYHAADIMVRKKYGCIPIVDEKKQVVGIITAIDIIKLFLDRANKDGSM